MSVQGFYGFGGILGLYDVRELTYRDGIKERTVITNVQGFEIQGAFMFATKRNVSAIVDPCYDFKPAIF